MRLKSWESPRRQGRNDKGKGGSARQRQLRKQMKMLTSKLKQGIEPTQKQGKPKTREINPSLFFVSLRPHHQKSSIIHCVNTIHLRSSATGCGQNKKNLWLLR